VGDRGYGFKISCKTSAFAQGGCVWGKVGVDVGAGKIAGWFDEGGG
jgi:hypothetical protein